MLDPQEHSNPITVLALVFAAGSLLGGTASAAPSIRLSERAGPPTSETLVSGRGFSANARVDIYFDTTVALLIVTDGNGEFEKARIHVPGSAYPGKHWVTGLEPNDAKSAQAPFLVQTNWSQFHFDARLSGLNPYENVLSPTTVSGMELRWKFSTANYAWSSAAVVNGVVYVGSEDGNLYALNAKTGSLVWKLNTGHPVTSSPAVADGLVYIGTGEGTFYALDAVTGTKLWRHIGGDPPNAAPVVTNGVVYVGTTVRLYALNAKTGVQIWSTPIISNTPLAVSGGVVFADSFNALTSTLQISALNAATGASLWSSGSASLVTTPPTVAASVVYFGSDKDVVALNATTGDQLWSFTAGDLVLATPAVANSMVYAGAWDDNLYALNANTGALLWTFRTAGLVTSSAAMANGVVYTACNNGNIYALDASTGILLWTYFVGGVESSPAVANGMVYLSSFDNNIYAFGLPVGPPAQPSEVTPPDAEVLRSASHRPSR